MGGAVSAGANNDELIDNLLEADYISSSDVEKVFRAVDRGHYFTPEYKERAYRDLAWKNGNLHISAPCIYSRVMENLKLGPGMSFLNLGSGTGYLSTMAGLLLGCNGINHGVEIHQDVLNYSVSKLGEFLLNSAAIDEYEFCEPKFVNGNCLHLGGSYRQYDRVYCGAACPENHENYMKNLIKVGGILVMPINDQLLQICRTSDTNWESKAVLPVSFATLITGKMSDCAETLKMPETDPLSLQDICKYAVRSILRKIIDIEHPELKSSSSPWRRVKKKHPRRFVTPLFSGNSDGEEDSQHHSVDTDDIDDQFLMDVTNIQTCKSIMEWSQILQGTSAHLLQAIEATCDERANAGSYRSTPTETQGKNDEMEVAMEEDINYIMSRKRNSTENDIMEDMLSDDEFLSDADEIQDILQKFDTVECGDGVERKASTDRAQHKKSENKSKREKIDSGVVEDIETGKNSITDEEDYGVEDDEDEYESELEENAYPPQKKSSSQKGIEMDDVCYDSGTEQNPKPEIEPGNSAPGEESQTVPVITYSTYMKEKINLLPLPMTLKYYLNLNREF